MTRSPSPSLLSLLSALGAKQEGLFQAMVHFHQLDLVRQEQLLMEAERKLTDSPQSGGYIEQQKQIHRLRVGGGSAWWTLCGWQCMVDPLWVAVHGGPFVDG